MLLRKTPLLEIKFVDNNLELLDLFEEKNSGIYNIKNVENIEFIKEETSWLPTVLSYILSFLTENVAPFGHKFKDSPKLKISLQEKEIVIGLEEVNLTKVQKIITLVKNSKELSAN